MTIVMTLLVRDEADIIDEQIAFHLSAGVDFILATDHRSSDGTTEILETYRRDGHLRLIRREDERIRQSEWMTRMARLAATEHGADWVINSDADEFWWPVDGTLHDVLGAVPNDYGAILAYSHSFVPRARVGWFAEQMTVRLASIAPINDPATPFRPVAKVAHRGDAAVVVEQGNHAVAAPHLRTLRGWCPIDLMHFPIRSPEQIARKHHNTVEAWRVNLRGDLARARFVPSDRGGEAFYARVALDDREVERGLADGFLVEDVRLRDALVGIEKGNRRISGAPNAGSGDRDLKRRSSAQDPSAAASFLTLTDANAVRLQRHIDELTARVVDLEGTPGGIRVPPQSLSRTG
jgi:glycosyl transferase family 2